MARQAELRLVIARLEDFAAKVRDGLAEVDWLMKRELIRTLVKRVEIGKEEVNVVFRVTPPPFDSSSDGGSLQDCWRGHGFSLWHPVVWQSNIGQLPHGSAQVGLGQYYYTTCPLIRQ